MDVPARRLPFGAVIGQEEGRGLMPQAGDDELTHAALVIVQVDRLVHVEADLA